MAGGTSPFFAMISRLKYIDRWALMRNARSENLAEHSLEVAVVAHALCVIANERHGRDLDANKAAVLGIFHDAPEIITGDMPTPVKYFSGTIRDAYKGVEAAATRKLVGTLPDDIRPTYEGIFASVEAHAAGGGDDVARDGDGACGDAGAAAHDGDAYLARVVKAADKICALLKCVEETASGNVEFERARVATVEKLDEMAATMPEVADFMREFLPAYGKTLDDLLDADARQAL